MGFYSLFLAGGGFFLIGAWEVLLSFFAILNPSSSVPVSPTRSNTIATPTTTTNRRSKRMFLSFLSFIGIGFLSFFFILNSLFSLIDAFQIKDRVGFVLQLEIIAVCSLFLLYSVVGLLTYLTDSYTFPSPILNLIALFAFVQEFLLFYLQRKDPSGIENRYFDLMLVPITVCVFSTIIELGYSKSSFPILARGFGLILQGTWFFQMGLSFFTSFMTHGCSLHEKSRGNYTVKCKGHPEYHRGRAIATLQFNCHLAFIVVLFVMVYRIFDQKYGAHGDYMNYRPINEELRQLDRQNQFTLDSDDDEDDGCEIKEEQNVVKQKDAVVIPESGINGFTH